MKPQFPIIILFTTHLYCSQNENFLFFVKHIKYSHRLALQYLNLYNLC